MEEIRTQEETAVIDEKWFMISPNEVKEKLTTSLSDGLSNEEVLVRMEKYGPNELTAEK